METLKEELLALPEKIRNQELTILEHEDAIAQEKKELDEWQSAMYLKVSEQLNETGKPKFSNDTMRSAEIKKQQTKEITRLQEAYEEHQMNVRKQKIQLNLLLNQMSVRKAICCLNYQNNI